MERTPLRKRPLPSYTFGEEVFNMVSHIVGGAFAIAALVLCVVMAVLHGNAWSIASAIVYGFTMILLYTMSSLYHGLRAPIAKRVFQVIDHCSIFLLIAGTYTPITLCSLRGENPLFGWIVFGVIWGVAVLGIILNAIDLKKYARFSMVCYIAMGWCVVLAAKPMMETVAMPGLLLLLLGGISYTIGAVLYGLGKKKLRYMHSVFHLFVVLGSVLHFFSILLYILPVR